MNRLIISILILCGCAICAAGQDTLRLTLQDAIDIALEQSVNAAMARNKQKTAYWQYRTFRAEQLPEISFDGTLPDYRRNYTSYQSEDGSYKFVRNNNIGLNGGLSLKQVIPFTGGSIALSTSMDYTRQIGSGSANEFMSVPIAVTLTQPIFAVNSNKWDRKIEPIRYEESQAQFSEEMEEVTLSTIGYFFNFVLAESTLENALQNLENAEKLYEVAVAKRKIGKISERELMQMKLSVLQAKSTLTDAVSALNSQMFRLRAFLGIDESRPIKPIVPEESPEGNYTYKQVLDAALQYNPFAKNILRRQLEADYAVAAAKGRRRSMDLYASFGFSGVNSNFKGAYNNLKNNQVVELGVSIPILDWGKRKGQVKIAESNRDVVETQIRQDEINFNQDIFLLVENYNNQAQQLSIAVESDSLAAERYDIAVKTFMVGEISILDLNDAREGKDSARAKMIQELYYYWNYYYNIRSVTAGMLH
ncbi:MAG: TolC family protein [Bacteroidales bacterium]|nr:TolC family protein [Bacteroidales bacterium]MDD4669751.1 TolC family protein [Bacteroidales bacterium]